MNERLKELYQQAHMVREYPADDPMRGGNPPTVYWGGERSAERFAELIVRECVDEIEFQYGGGRETVDGTHSKDWDAAVKCVSAMVRHRFGVE